MSLLNQSALRNPKVLSRMATRNNKPVGINQVTYYSTHYDIQQKQYATSISFASPYSDVFAPTNHEIKLSDQFFSTISYSTPFSDFASSAQELKDIDIQDEPIDKSHFEYMTFSTPMTDFMGREVERPNIITAKVLKNVDSLMHNHLVSHKSTISFGSPFADFAAPSASELEHDNEFQSHSTNISFASPFSDYVAPCKSEQELAESYQVSHNISFSSPLSDVVAPTLDEQEAIHTDEKDHSTVSYSFATPMSDVSAPTVAEMKREHQQPSFYMSYGSPFSDYVSQTSHHIVDKEEYFMKSIDEAAFFSSLPKTFEIAQQYSQYSSQARVITEAAAPFKITYVNDAWVGLCGFSAHDAVGKTLQLIQGKKTDVKILNRIKNGVDNKAEVSIRVINYRSNGQEFANHLRLVPLTSNIGNEEVVTHYLGVLEDVSHLQQNMQ
eukprot:gene7684-10454_t